MVSRIGGSYGGVDFNSFQSRNREAYGFKGTLREPLLYAPQS